MIFRSSRARILRAVLLALVVCATLSGCISAKMYVDPGLPKVGRTDMPVLPETHPVQVLFEFQTKGNANARATSEIQSRVVAVAAESGLFSKISTSADQSDAGILKIVINNTPLTDNAAAKGFGTGLTLGLAGSLVKDGYVCTASYSRDNKTTEVLVNHAIYTTIGNHSAPEGLTPMDPQSAVHLAMDQITWNVLKQLAEKKAF